MLHEIVKLSFLSPNGSPGTILVKTWNTDIDSCTIYFRKYLFRRPTNHCQMIKLLQHSIFDILWFWFFTGWRQPQPKLPHPPQPPFLGSALPKDVVNATLTKVGQALPPLSELWPRYLQSIGGLGRYRWPPGYLVYELNTNFKIISDFQLIKSPSSVIQNLKSISKHQKGHCRLFSF